MEMDSLRAQHEQDMSSHETLESMLVCTKAASQQVLDNKKPRPQDQQPQKCPRCDSSNTKFCYYNNYSLTQPRYFCKSCRRYWTKGGTLRNVPVGGGCRKNNKRSSSSSSNSSASSKIRTIYQDHHHHPQPPLLTSNHNHPLLPYDSTDLSLAFARLQNGQLGFDHDHNNHISILGNYANNDHGSFLDAMRYGNFLETQPIINNGLQNVYNYGEDHHFENVGNMSHHEEMGNLPYEDLMSGGGGGGSSGATTTAVSVTTVKQERSNVGADAAEGRGMVLCGYPWQIGNGGGDHGGMSSMGDVDATGRQSSWINGFGGSNWHGLINSPLM